LTHVALFDVDGTLTDTNAIDTVCFIEALHDEFGIDSVDDDWSTYTHTTDRGILTEILRRAWSRQPAEADLQRHRERFLTILRERMTSVREIAGAIAFLPFLREKGWTIVLCTGAWRASARLKLDRAGFPADLVISACDEAESREEILRNGLRHVPSASRVVVFGDAVWDVRAARNEQLPFIGVGERSGAEHVVADYTDPAAVLRLMSEARAPR